MKRGASVSGGVSLGARLPEEFFERAPHEVAPDLIGMALLSTAGGVLTGGVIVETEAYGGRDDPGSHAATRGVTRRNEVMYGPPGTVYVYIVYGVHHMVNLVCEPRGRAGAVLIRAFEPLVGIETMRARRSGGSNRGLASGPGRLAQSLGIGAAHNGTLLGAGDLVVCRSRVVVRGDIETSCRIGLSSGCDLELRYTLRGSPYVSHGRPGRARMRRMGARES